MRQKLGLSKYYTDGWRSIFVIVCSQDKGYSSGSSSIVPPSTSYMYDLMDQDAGPFAQSLP